MSEAYSANDTDKFKKTTKKIWQTFLEKKFYELFSNSVEYKNESFGLTTTAKPECAFMNYAGEKYVKYSGESGGTFEFDKKDDKYLFVKAISE